MMAQLKNVAILITVTAVLLQSTKAEDYMVGGSTRWTSFPPGGASFYSKWASNFTFKVNDTLVFSFESGSHSVVELTKANYDKCEVNDNIRVFNRGPARITLNSTGEFYFSCTFSGHCSSGQKLSIKVSGTSSPLPAPAPTAKKAPAPGKVPAEGPSASAPPPASGSVPSSPSNEGAPSSPTEPGAIAPPPQGSAIPLAATFSLLLITIAINFLSQF